jgi:hypothetical protein
MGNDEIYKVFFLFVNMYVVFGFSTCLLNCSILLKKLIELKKLNYHCMIELISLQVMKRPS